MKQVDLTRLAPPGIDLKSDCKRFYGFLAAAAVFAILVFGVKYRSGYDDLFVWDGVKHRFFKKTEEYMVIAAFIWH